MGEIGDGLEKALRLMKSGVAPEQLEATLRREPLGLKATPGWAESLTLCEDGVVLGEGTVIAPLTELPTGGTGLEIEGREAGILTLLSIARADLAPPQVLEKLASASRALAKGNTAQAAITLCQLGQPPLQDRALAKSLAFAADQLQKGKKPLDILKIAGLVSSDFFTKASCVWIEDDHPRQGEGAKNPGWFACKAGSIDETGRKLTEKQINDDQKHPYKILTLSDGSKIIGYKGTSICLPSDVSLYENVKFGERLRGLPSDVRTADMVLLFSPYIGLMDYQRTHSSDDKYNLRYIDFGNFNYGAVAAAAGYDEEEAVRYAAYVNQLGQGDKTGKYGSNPRNEAMIRAGWHTYHDDKIPNDSKND